MGQGERVIDRQRGREREEERDRELDREIGGESEGERGEKERGRERERARKRESERDERREGGRVREGGREGGRDGCVQCSAVQCSAVQCSAVQCSAVQCSAVQEVCSLQTKQYEAWSILTEKFFLRLTIWTLQSDESLQLCAKIYLVCTMATTMLRRRSRQDISYTVTKGIQNWLSTNIFPEPCYTCSLEGHSIPANPPLLGKPLFPAGIKSGEPVAIRGRQWERDQLSGNKGQVMGAVWTGLREQERRNCGPVQVAQVKQVLATFRQVYRELCFLVDWHRFYRNTLYMSFTFIYYSKLHAHCK